MNHVQTTCIRWRSISQTTNGDVLFHSNSPSSKTKLISTLNYFFPEPFELLRAIDCKVAKESVHIRIMVVAVQLQLSVCLEPQVLCEFLFVEIFERLSQLNPHTFYVVCCHAHGNISVKVKATESALMTDCLMFESFF